MLVLILLNSRSINEILQKKIIFIIGTNQKHVPQKQTNKKTNHTFEVY